MGGRQIITDNNCKQYRFASSGAISREVRRHNAAHKASDKDKLFDPGSVYSPAAVAAASLGEGGNLVISWFAELFFLCLGLISSLNKIDTSLQQFNPRYTEK